MQYSTSGNNTSQTTYNYNNNNSNNIHLNNNNNITADTYFGCRQPGHRVDQCPLKIDTLPLLSLWPAIRQPPLELDAQRFGTLDRPEGMPQILGKAV